MQKPTNSAVVVRVIEDVSQQNIIQNRRKLREQTLKQLGQRISVTEQAIERLNQLTR